jgi:hypothetical protein
MSVLFIDDNDDDDNNNNNINVHRSNTNIGFLGVPPFSPCLSQ